MDKRLKLSVIGGAFSPMLETLRVAARRLERLRSDGGAMTDNERMDAMNPINIAAAKVLNLFPLAVADTMEQDIDRPNNPVVASDNVQTQVDLFGQFKVEIRGKQCTLQLGPQLDQGAFNHIIEAQWNEDINAVVKTGIIIPNYVDLMMEAVVHAIVCQSKTLEPYFVRMLAAMRLPIDYWPGRQFAVVQEYHPGMDLGQYICGFQMSAVDYVSILQQIAFILHLAQDKMQFMHRDLKVDNIMIFNESVAEDKQRVLSAEKLAEYTRPPVMRCDGVAFTTEGHSVQLMDLGASFLSIGGEQFAIPICQIEESFNPRTDLAHLCYTLAEDFEDDIRKYAPEILPFLKHLCAPLYKVREEHKAAEVREQKQHLREQSKINKHPLQREDDGLVQYKETDVVGISLQQICQQCEAEVFVPANLIKALQAFRATLPPGCVRA